MSHTRASKFPKLVVQCAKPSYSQLQQSSPKGTDMLVRYAKPKHGEMSFLFLIVESAEWRKYNFEIQL